MGYAETAAFERVQLSDVMAMISRLTHWFKSFPGKKVRERWHRCNSLDQRWALGLWLAALPLYLVNLGGPALRDWDEGTVAQVAREIVEKSLLPGDGAGSGALFPWMLQVQNFGQGLLQPTIWDQAYVNKPPLMHGLIAVLFRVWGESEWTARLPGAMLTALSVPLLYLIGRELFVTRRPAVFGTIAYLTLLPVVRHGRLAMLDGAIICFYLVTVLAGLRSRRNARWCLGVGLGIGLMCLTKSFLGLLLGGLLLAFLAWDTPRLLRSGYLWSGLALGMAPALAWFGNQAVSGAEDFVQQGLVDQSLKRLWQSVENNQGSVFYYVGELLEWGWPWVMFVPGALVKSWRERSLSWGRLVLVLGGGYFAVISLAQTKLPWYIMPLYPLLALAIGPVLADYWDRLGGATVEPYTPGRIPSAWLGLMGLLFIIALAGSLYFSVGPEAALGLAIPFVCLALGMGLSGWLLWRRDAQWILVLAWGWYLGIFALMASPHWVFELTDGPRVKPMAAVIRAEAKEPIRVYTTYPTERPSLNFYADRHILPFCYAPEAMYPAEPFYLWLKPEEQAVLKMTTPPLGAAEDWQLQGPLQLTQPTAKDELRSRLNNFCRPGEEAG